MSFLKQVKNTLKSGNVEKLVIQYEDGSSEELSIDEEYRSKDSIKRLLQAVDWESVEEVQIVVNEGD